MKRQACYIFVVLLIFCFNAKAQFPKVVIPGSEIRKISSNIVSGQEYELQVLLPANYKTGNKKYPVVYLMDAQWDLPLLKSLYGQQYYDGFIPELIIVGVTWGGSNPNPDSLRARDYTPTRQENFKQSGGADQFLSFMKEELFPFIETNYRADPGNRTLMGCSLGGLITLYAMFTHTDMFNGYAAASPAIGWDKEVLYRYENDFANKKSWKSVSVYMTVGDVEKGKAGFEKFAAQMKLGNYPNVRLRSKVLENTGHSGTKSETFSRGLQFIFEKNDITLSPEKLDSYCGSYLLQNGNTVELKKENGRLVLLFPPNNKYILYANSVTEFYAKSEFMNIYFSVVDGKVEGFELERYGNTQFVRK